MTQIRSKAGSRKKKERLRRLQELLRNREYRVDTGRLIAALIRSASVKPG